VLDKPSVGYAPGASTQPKITSPISESEQRQQIDRERGRVNSLQKVSPHPNTADLWITGVNLSYPYGLDQMKKGGKKDER